MKSFDIITEADARLLEIGSTVELAPRGHITPLAADTLRDAGSRCSRADGARESSTVAPLADIKPSRDRQRSLRRGAAPAPCVDHLRQRGTGRDETSAPRAPSRSTTRTSPRGRAGRGARGSRRRHRHRRRRPRIGIAANKIAGVRAAMCTDKTLARYAREHNGANVLALGATLISTDAAMAIVETWLGRR